MVSIFNVFALMGISLLTGLVTAIIILDKNKHDYEDDYEEGCTSSRHLFPPHLDKKELYCFCQKEVLKLSSEKGFLIVKR